MAITADHIRTILTAYLDEHPDEKPTLAPVLHLLDEGADLASRKEFRGHATAGAVLAGPDGRILHIHHLALDKWLLPGGHLEADDSTLLDAARRELAEETGIPADTVASVDDTPLHIDVHPIPANQAKSEPGHQHIDFRFLFRTTAEVGELQTEEVTDAAWRTVETLHDERLKRRVAAALR
ncbi:NUDIX domain-containing protein [Streptomyces piniterrae]|uniref:NUDIX domain-containing protein n=1 Tax=Streptomyces piniterrae TaxID=2571125 RepID=A0A4U0MQ35_9ACTN|nr:NUDIX domain-containing protein [Streptomyces piniterrae]TJZ42873.1 NUDIX domain-containing protein [Streptomyces piniterrae]